MQCEQPELPTDDVYTHTRGCHLSRFMRGLCSQEATRCLFVLYASRNNDHTRQQRRRVSHPLTASLHPKQELKIVSENKRLTVGCRMHVWRKSSV